MTQASQLGLRNTTVTGAQYVTSPSGAYCEVSATVEPSHDMRVRLPDAWQQRYLQLGGAGFDGGIADLNSPFASSGRDPVASGYVVAGDNGGHRGNVYPGASFAVDRGLTLSYASAKIYDTSMVAKALMQSYYGGQPRYRYFDGCSNGGKNASVAASNFANLFDGVIGGNGAWGHASDEVGGSDMTGLVTQWSRSVQAGALSPAKAQIFYNAVVQACDALDGIADGLVSNVQACPIEQVVNRLRCKGADNGNCLTDSDIDKVGAHLTLFAPTGQVIAAPWSPTANLANVADPGLPSGALGLALRSAMPIDPNSYNSMEQYYDIASVFDGIYSMTGGLDGVVKYLKRGKKLIIEHGWDDTTVPSYITVNFFTKLQSVDFAASQGARLYMVPGVGHCGGGNGTDSMDLLSVIAKWVENNSEPGSPGNLAIAWKQGSTSGLIGAQFSRPLCPFPQFANYNGSGDSRQASSYSCRLGAAPSAKAFSKR